MLLFRPLADEVQTDSGERGMERHRNWADEVEGEQERLHGYYRRGGNSFIWLKITALGF